jgi:subtilase family serine protease
VTSLYREMRRLDGIQMLYGNPPPDVSLGMTFGNLFPSVSRSGTWYFKGDTPGAKTFIFRVWGENGTDFTIGQTVVVGANLVDLVPMSLGTSPPAPVAAPGTTFSVTDTVQNAGPGPSEPSTLRYYLSLDALKGPGDTLLGGNRSTPALEAGASHTATVTVTVPPGTPLDAYFLLACADSGNNVPEADEANNCMATPGPVVTVAKPDLVESAVSSPPASQKRGTKFSVTDTARNQGAAASKGSKTRYYLSLDPVKSAADRALTGSRTVPGLAAGAADSGTVTVTIPSATPLDTYFLLACADQGKTVAETDETNNCKASSASITVTP